MWNRFDEDINMAYTLIEWKIGLSKYLFINEDGEIVKEKDE